MLRFRSLFILISLLPAILLAATGTLSGTVYRSDSTTKIIKGAKIVFFANNLKVDSATSDSLGNYSRVLNEASYTVKSSCPSFRSSKGLLTRDTAITITSGVTNSLSVYLTPATGMIKGTVTYHVSANPPQDPPFNNARVYLERRTGSSTGLNNWILIDSTHSDTAGFYSFPGLIPATGGDPPPFGTVNTSKPGGNYRVLVIAKGWAPNFDTNQILTSTTPGKLDTVGFAPGSITVEDIRLTPTINSVYGFFNDPRKGIHFTRSDDQLVLFIASASFFRTIQVFNPNGRLQDQLVIPAGESKAILPAIYAPEKGFIFCIK